MQEVDSVQTSLAARYEPDFLLLRVKHAQQDAERNSSRLADEFLKPSCSKGVDDFIEEYRRLRQSYHKKRILTEGNVNWS